MDEKRAFLRAIAEAGDDDTPRLAYADWIQEHSDEELAGCIRRGIAYTGTVVFCANFKNRNWVIWGRHGNGFVGSAEIVHKMIPPPYPMQEFRVHVHRGFPCDFTVSMNWWIEHGDAVLENCPRPTVRVDLSEGKWKWVARSGNPGSIRGVFHQIGYTDFPRHYFGGHKWPGAERLPESQKLRPVAHGKQHSIPDELSEDVYHELLTATWPDAQFYYTE